MKYIVISFILLTSCATTSKTNRLCDGKYVFNYIRQCDKKCNANDMKCKQYCKEDAEERFCVEL